MALTGYSCSDMHGAGKVARQLANEVVFEETAFSLAFRGCKMDFQKVGRARMMMRLPRHRKQIADANFVAITDLLEAYGKAAVTRDELREQAAPAPALLKEYEDLCRKLEDDILRMLSAVSPRMIR